jgi:hypothetical protein
VSIPFRKSEHGLSCVGLKTELLELVVVPELGAKIISLKNLRTGREWLAAPDSNRALFRNAPGDPFTQSTYVGWDECFPTIDPCRWEGRRLPDHGEVWSLPWTLNESAFAGGAIETEITLPVSPFKLSRSIYIERDQVQLRYALENLSDKEERFIWAAHPLLATEPGDRLELPPATRRQLGDPPWLASLQFASDHRGWEKQFAGPVEVAAAAIVNDRTGDCLSFEWDPKENDTLAVWLSRGGWNNVDQFSLEPTNATHESLAVAAQPPHRCGGIAAGGKLSWSLRLSSCAIF